ncbi:MAG: hypothetical protein PVH17_03710 [Anaerolineae bacterium]
MSIFGQDGATRRWVRHQSNWFRRDDPRIHWLDVTRESQDRALDLLRRFLQPSFPADSVVQ